jgi:hypothetical protein
MATYTEIKTMKSYFAEGREVVAYVMQVNAISGVRQSWHEHVSLEKDEIAAIKKADKLNKKEAAK